jgi:chlorobactene lauroyltransferase
MIEARKNRLFEHLFLAYTRRSMSRHFNGVHVGGWENVRRLDRSLPIIIYCNHSSWWDAMLAFVLAKQVLDVDAYAMMEEKQLRRYAFFRRIGAFSVDRESPRSAVASMRYAASIFTKPNVALWIYPQGIMVPNDTRPLNFYPGIARIAAMAGQVQCVPVVHRFEFLMEQRPEAFTMIGEPWLLQDAGKPGEVTEALEKKLTALLDTLRCAITKNEMQGFTRILSGRSSVSTRYDKLRLFQEDR